MKLPELPTDNLYKFMALCGVILLLACLVPHFHVHELRLRVIRLAGEVERIKTQKEWTLTDCNQIEKDITKLEHEIGQVKKATPSETLMPGSFEGGIAGVSEETGAEVDVARKKRDRAVAKGEEAIQRMREYTMATIELQTKANELDYLISMITREIWATIIAGLVGLCLSGTGFACWYRRLQIVQDKILQAKAAAKENEEI